MTTSPYIQVTGKSNLLIGFPDDDYATMHRMGEQLDDTKMTIENVLHEVPADSQGGPQGDPVEFQILAHRIRGQFNLSKWDHTVYERIQRHNLMAKEGHFADHEIGGLLLRDRSFRIVISPSRSNPIPAEDPISDVVHDYAGSDYNYRNFPCCLIDSPIAIGVGTKFSALQFSVRAFRVPEGHPLEPSAENGGTASSSFRDGLIWNRDKTGVANNLLPQSMQTV